jgi:hypothetical protein
MTQRLLLLAALAFLFPRAVTADPPSTKPAPPRPGFPRPGFLNEQPPPVNTAVLDAQRRNIRTRQQMYDGMPIVATYALRDVLKLSLLDGQLHLDIGPIDLPRGQSRITIEGSSATWLVQTASPRGSSGNFSINRFDWDQTAEGQAWSTSLSRGDGYVALSASGVGASWSYRQANGMVMLVIIENPTTRPRQVLRFDAQSLLRLQAEHPDEVHRYLAPLLRRFTDVDLLSPGAADVYRVFSELPIDGDVARQVLELLPALDSFSFPERAAASDRLAALGRPGVQAVLKLDRSLLSFEQNDRIDAFLATERRRLPDDPASLRRNPAFLIDCLEDADPAVRAAAKASLERVLGHRIDFDPDDADAEARANSADELRASVKRQLQERPSDTQPTTQTQSLRIDNTGPRRPATVAELFTAPPLPHLRSRP